MNILFLSRWFPDPPDNGSKLRIYNLLCGLAPHHTITLLSFTDSLDVNLDALEIRSLCSDIQTVLWKPFNPHSWPSRLGFLHPTPRSLIDTFSPDIKNKIEQALLSKDYDLVIASQIDMTIFGRYFQSIPALFDEIEVGVPYDRFKNAASVWPRFRSWLTWSKYRRYLISTQRYFRAATVVSDQEYHLVREILPKSSLVEVIPNCINLESYGTIDNRPQPNTLIFTGAFSYFPNYEAMVWFLEYVYSRIQAQIPEVQLFITGKHGNRPLPAVDNVTLTGYVDDIRPWVASASISIVPLHTGGGTRLKILEAMALRTPVVATSKGAEGLETQNGEHLLIADSPQAFAEAVIRLLQDSELRRRLAENAYRFVRERYDLAVVMPRFLNLVERAAA